MAFHINLDDIDLYYRLFKEDIDINLESRMMFIKKDHLIYNDYVRLVNEVHKLNNTNRLTGGADGIVVAGAVIGSIIITSVVASLFWYFLMSNNVCKTSYPLYPKNQLPKVGDIIEKVLPASWIAEGLNSGKSLEQTINEISHYLSSITDTFSIFDETVGTTSTQILKSVSKGSDRDFGYGRG